MSKAALGAALAGHRDWPEAALWNRIRRRIVTAPPPPHERTQAP